MCWVLMDSWIKLTNFMNASIKKEQPFILQILQHCFCFCKVFEFNLDLHIRAVAPYNISCASENFELISFNINFSGSDLFCG